MKVGDLVEVVTLTVENNDGFAVCGTITEFDHDDFIWVKLENGADYRAARSELEVDHG